MGWFSRPRLGGDAIRARLSEVTGCADVFTFAFDGVDVLAFFVQEPLPHVLYCTYGVSAVNSSQKVAGTQTELTMRVPDTDLPEKWPAEQLARMARRLRRTGREIAPGHHMTTPRGKVPAYLFVTDPVLGLIDGPTGLIRFTYAVGLTAEDYESVLQWDPVKFAGVLGDVFPLGLTDPAREPLAAHPEAKRRVEEATVAEGSSLGAVLASYLETDESGRVDLDIVAARALLRGARHRLKHSRPFALVRGETWFMLDPRAERSEFAADHILLAATRDVANELLAVFDAVPGTYTLRTCPVTLQVIDPER